jgi:hypothetical protein
VLLAINNASVQETQVKGRDNAAPITQVMIGAACRFPGRNPEIGVAMHQELVCKCVCIEYPKVHIYIPETFYFI